MHPVVLMVTVEKKTHSAYYADDYVYLNGNLIGCRPHDGSEPMEVADQVMGALASMLGKELGWEII